MNKLIKNQILEIRDTGLTNMFDLLMVQNLAFERKFYELVDYLESKENKGKYVRFILYGETESENS